MTIGTRERVSISLQFSLVSDTERLPFTFAGPDGRTLHGTLDFPVDQDSRPVVVITHGFKGFQEWGFFPYLAELLAARGFVVVRWNTSGAGMLPGDEMVTDLDAFARATFSDDVDELRALIGALPEIVGDRGRTDHLGLLGHSRGGGATIIAATEIDPKPLAVVTWASVATFDRISERDKEAWREQGWLPVVNSRTGQQLRMDVSVLEDLEFNRARLTITTAAAKLTSPWLILHGDDDVSVSVDDARKLAQANPRAEKHEVVGAGHTFEARHPFRGPTPALIEAMNATQTWFLRYLS